MSLRASRFEIRVNTFDVRQRLDSQCLTCVHKKYLDYQKYLTLEKYLHNLILAQCPQRHCQLCDTLCLKLVCCELETGPFNSW